MDCRNLSEGELRALLHRINSQRDELWDQAVEIGQALDRILFGTSSESRDAVAVPGTLESVVAVEK